MRKHNVKQINLQIDDIEFVKDGFIILWSSDIGFGEYTVAKEQEKLFGYSECMDRGDDKEFLKELLEKALEYIVKKIEIVE